MRSVRAACCLQRAVHATEKQRTIPPFLLNFNAGAPVLSTSTRVSLGLFHSSRKRSGLYCHQTRWSHGRFVSINNSLHRSFATSSSSCCDDERGGSYAATKNISSTFVAGNYDCPLVFSHLKVTPSPRGYQIEILMNRQQQHRRRSFSESSSTGEGGSPNNSDDLHDNEIPPNIKAERKERRKRLTVLYPYNEQDVLRKQRKRKEEARKRTVANVNRALMGNVVIAGSKLFAWLCSQSSSMLSEFIHSCVDCANQYLLLQGLKDSSKASDRKHPYGYGKSVYFWALVSALGTFFMGFGISGVHAWGELMNPSLHVIGPEVVGVLGFSFLVDGYVLTKTFKEIRKEMPKDTKLWDHVKSMRDPATLAILLEDGAACFGVLLAIAGTSCAHATGHAVYDGLAGLSISALLGTMGVVLASVNYRFLLGQAVDKEITDNIAQILKRRRSIDTVTSVQSQWTGPDTFSYKAEVGFDGTFLAAKLMPTHEKEFFAIRDTMKKDLPLVLSWYAEDVIRAVEQEVRIIEAEIRKRYPAAEYIELEPKGTDSHEFAIDDNFEKDLRKLESENLEKLRKLMPSLDPALEAADERASGAPVPHSETFETGTVEGSRPSKK